MGQYLNIDKFKRLIPLTAPYFKLCLKKQLILISG